MPQEIIDTLPQGQKQLIFDTLDETAVFEEHDIKNYRITEDGEALEIEDVSPVTRAGIISRADLTISVVGYAQTYNGYQTYAVFPSFDWSKRVDINNDSFAMALYPGWEVVPGASNCNMRVWIRNGAGETVQYHDISDPQSSSSNGYSFLIPNNVGTANGDYEGHAFLRGKKNSSSATHAISLNYIHDNSSIFSASYSVGIGPGSISVSGNTNNLSYLSGNYTF